MFIFHYVFKDVRAEQWQNFQLTAALVCYCNIYNQFCYDMKRHSMTDIYVLRLLEMHRETFIFFWTLFINKTEIIPLLTEHSFKTLHQNSIKHLQVTWSPKFPDMVQFWHKLSCNFDIIQLVNSAFLCIFQFIVVQHGMSE